MSVLMTAVLVSVLALAAALMLFWGYWAVRISVNETRKITNKFRRSEINSRVGEDAPARDREAVNT